MSYSSYENSAAEGSPIELYEFVGTYTTYRYTSAAFPVTFEGQDYEPISINRASITTGTQVDDQVDCQIDIQYDAQICVDYAYSGVSAPDLSLTIFRYHYGENPDDSAIVYWSGQVTNFLANGHTVTIQVPTFFSYGISGDVPNICYQTLCNHVLFDSHCGVSRTANSVSATIESISGVTLILTEGLGFATNYLNGGEVVDLKQNERRMIIAYEDNTITLAFPFSKNVTAGDSVQVTSGCNHSYIGDCLNKYNNQKQFGGFPFTPTINPFTGLF